MSLSPEDRYYSYSPEDRLELHDTANEARAAAVLIISDFRDDGDWHEAIESVSWGLIIPVERATMVDETPCECGDHDHHCDYELQPVGDDPLAELEKLRAAVLQIAADIEQTSNLDGAGLYISTICESWATELRELAAGETE